MDLAEWVAAFVTTCRRARGISLAGQQGASNTKSQSNDLNLTVLYLLLITVISTSCCFFQSLWFVKLLGSLLFWPPKLFAILPALAFDLLDQKRSLRNDRHLLETWKACWDGFTGAMISEHWRALIPCFTDVHGFSATLADCMTCWWHVDPSSSTNNVVCILLPFHQLLAPVGMFLCLCVHVLAAVWVQKAVVSYHGGSKRALWVSESSEVERKARARQSFQTWTSLVCGCCHLRGLPLLHRDGWPKPSTET